MLWPSLSFYSLVIATSIVQAADPAWNGHTTPGATTPAPFTPYYVPPGARSYDSSSPLIQYSGDWGESFSSGYVQGSVRKTSAVNAYVSFTFTGTGVEWFGNMGAKNGIAEVFLDGKLAQRIDGWNPSPMRQQRLFWAFDLAPTKHTIKIVNSGTHRNQAAGTSMVIDAFVVTDSPADETLLAAPPSPPSQNFAVSSSPPYQDLAASAPSSEQWTLEQTGSTGVHAMQLAVISDTHAIIIDKVEHNPLTISGHPAWGALYNLNTHSVKPLNMQSNSFCAGGTFLGNGTLINVGGNPVVEGITAAADFGDVDGLQAVRIFEPCNSEDVDNCDIYENHSRIRMASPRWYNTVLRISDGSAMIVGGSKKGGWINNGTTNNPTVEYFPPKNIAGINGLPIHLPFLVDTLNSNLFPIAFSLPDGKVFMAANRDAMIYDWQGNVERRLPRIPNGVRVTYPMTGTGLLLPLSAANDYTAEILLCGGSTVDDTMADYQISSQDPASNQCARLVLTDNGIAQGWQVEQMPQARVMPDAVLLPDGKILIVNGGATGISGYGNVKDQIGASNADNPVFTPVLYDPSAPSGQRFSSSGMPTSDIPRLYHSVATLTPSGKVMIAGSNPNLDRSEVAYGTEYRVEWISPPYMSAGRPSFGDGIPKKIGFGQTVKMQVQMPASASDVKVVLMDLGYVTHATHANSRHVTLGTSWSSDEKSSLSVVGPPNGNIYPPGPGWLYLVVDGVPSTGVKVMIGNGDSPPVDREALRNLLAQTQVDQNEHS
ncbi:copper radical oxidase [Cristinia sonorae]|uniref:Copper radical oxidase n=1 Tax=Cristinia sonorae TaxID=1940300 RepID=A0A8K0UZD0_9AGAR|nr:copper radical oxidase [Cristinia sonorae]